VAVLRDGGVSDREDVPAEDLDLTNKFWKSLSGMERDLILLRSGPCSNRSDLQKTAHVIGLAPTHLSFFSWSNANAALAAPDSMFQRWSDYNFHFHIF
jgi:hypothetical protein